MINAEVIIPNARGLHARASARFVTCASGFDAHITARAAGRSVSADSIMELLMLAAAKGTSLTISAKGPQATEAVAALCALVEDGFGENG
ncbi:MAG: HPr family phosphocarrier protein [Robiginitomaculum sp.]|nr:MAG: HPr family phosphocarrier protein [Robiginitomaculum sp.]